MLKKYLHALVQSIYSPELYRSVIRDWQGFGGVYLLILGAITSLSVISLMIYSVQVFGEKELPYILRQIPTVHIDNGIVSVEGKQPITVSSRGNTFNVMLNTDATRDDLMKTDAQLAVGKDFFVINKGRGRTEVQELKDVEGKVTINRDVVASFWPKLRWIPLIGVPFIALAQFIGFLVQALLVATFSYGLTAFLHEEFNFETRMRLSAIALTPPILVSKILLFSVGHQTALWFDWLLALLYIYVMLMAIRRLDKDITVS